MIIYAGKEKHLEETQSGSSFLCPRCPSVRPSVCTNLTCKHFPITPKLIHLQGSYLV